MSGLQNNNSSLIKKYCYALGDFDGVHLGHRALLEAAVNNGPGLIPAVYTFKDNCKGAPLVTTPAEKKELMLSIGVQAVVFDRFDAVKDLSPEQFVDEILVRSLDAGAVVCGEDYRFGRGASGSAADLKRLCDAVGIQVIIVGEYSVDGRKISSSDVRTLIERGDMQAAERLLGRPFSVSGTVGAGKHIGEKNGVPTVNIALELGRVLPPYGVYASRIVIGDKAYNGVSDLGVMPSVQKLCSPRVETYVFDFSGNIYGQTVKVSFLKFIRPEKTFSDVRSLYKQINSDVVVARDFFNGDKHEKN